MWASLAQENVNFCVMKDWKKAKGWRIASLGLDEEETEICLFDWKVTIIYHVTMNSVPFSLPPFHYDSPASCGFYHQHSQVH